MPRSRFSTPIKKYSVESEPLLFPISYGPVQLNRTIKNLLKGNNIDTTDIQFNFFINGCLLKNSLKEFIEFNDISEEIEEIVYDVDSKPKLENETTLNDRVFMMRFSSKWLVTATHECQIFDSSSPDKPVVFIENDYDILQVDWINIDKNTNEAVIIGGGQDGKVSMWKCDLINGIYEKIFDLKGHRNCVNHIKVSPDSNLIASGSSDGMLKIWSASQDVSDLSVETGGIPHLSKRKKVDKILIRIPRLTLQGHSQNVCSIKWLDPAINVPNEAQHNDTISTSGNLVTSGNDYLVKLWNINGSDSNVVREFKNSTQIRGMDYNNDKQLMLASSTDNRLRMFDFRANEILAHNIADAHQFNLTVVKWNPINYNVFITGCNKGVTKLWDVRNMKSSVKILSECPMPITCCDWRQDGEILVHSYAEMKMGNPIGYLKFYKFDC